MRLDIVTLFPDYFAPLQLSLIGKAQRTGLLDVHLHQLRDFAYDKHRTVDDTPVGGGAGMVMKPEPWQAALRHVLDTGQQALGEAAPPILIIPGPSGQPFNQGIAGTLAQAPWLVFACGRYEGIDERVYQWARQQADLRILSLGDYVLNGGEVAVLAITEAIARLIPGVIGNAASLAEESHTDGLLEYPLYTKPALWECEGAVRRVPEVLLSGDHARIAAWRQQQREERTASRRPDLT